MATEYLDVLRLSRTETERLLSMAKKEDKRYDETDNRSEDRQSYEGHSVVFLEVSYPRAGVGNYRAITRNISAGGLGFLHGKFAYPGSPCRVLLKWDDGSSRFVDGTIAHCRLLEGRVHDVGMEFEETIDPENVTIGGEFETN